MWPEFRVERLMPKGEMASVMHAFGAYYTSTQHGGDAKELSWVFCYGSASVKPVYGGRTKGTLAAMRAI